MAGRFGTWRVSLELGLIPDIEDLQDYTVVLRECVLGLVFCPRIWSWQREITWIRG